MLAQMVAQGHEQPETSERIVQRITITRHTNHKIKICQNVENPTTIPSPRDHYSVFMHMPTGCPTPGAALALLARTASRVSRVAPAISVGGALAARGCWSGLRLLLVSQKSNRFEIKQSIRILTPIYNHKNEMEN